LLGGGAAKGSGQGMVGVGVGLGVLVALGVGVSVGSGVSVGVSVALGGAPPQQREHQLEARRGAGRRSASRFRRAGGRLRWQQHGRFGRLLLTRHRLSGPSQHRAKSAPIVPEQPQATN